VSGYVGDQTLEDILVSAQVDAAHTSGVIVMCEASFDPFGPEASKQCAPFSFDPASVRIYSIAGIVFPLPLTAPPVGFGDVAAYTALLQTQYCLVAVVAFVSDDFGQRFIVYVLTGLGVRDDWFEGLCGLSQRFRQRLRISFVARTERHGDDRAGLQIRYVLGFVRQMRTPVLHLRNTGIRVVGIVPLFVRGLLLSLLVELPDVFAIGFSMPEASARRVT